MAHVCMLIPISRHQRIANQDKKNKYENHDQYEFLIYYKEIKNTHKFLCQPIFSLSSYLMSWLGFDLFTFFKQNNWKLIFNVELINEMYIILKINDFIHLNHVVVGMAPPTMQLCPFPWPSPYTLFWTSLLAHFTYHLVHPLGFS